MNQKIVKIREEMKNMDIQGLIICNPINIKYITGVDSEGEILITDKENIFITDARYIETVKNGITIEDEISIYDAANISEEEYISFFEDCNKVGFEEDYVTYSKYNNMVRKLRIKETSETNNLIERMRSIKDDEEIENIEIACNITDSCFLHILEYVKAGITEKEIAFEIEKFFIQNGADGLAFETIVASGVNTSKPHSIPSNRKIQNDDIILIDMGAKYKGYCADMTRTFFIGKVSDEEQKLYNLVLKAQESVMQKIKDGVDGKVISNDVQRYFNENNYGLIHALGHGVGLDVHELPYLSFRVSHILKENMIVTNEPGIYIPGKIGIRIEDTVKVNKLEPEILTKSNKNLIII